nr:hypothetical protein TorRG33x02_046220 [Ipomoea trifida]
MCSLSISDALWIERLPNRAWLLSIVSPFSHLVSGIPALKPIQALSGSFSATDVISITAMAELYCTSSLPFSSSTAKQSRALDSGVNGGCLASNGVFAVFLDEDRLVSGDRREAEVLVVARVGGGGDAEEPRHVADRVIQLALHLPERRRGNDGEHALHQAVRAALHHQRQRLLQNLLRVLQYPPRRPLVQIVARTRRLPQQRRQLLRLRLQLRAFLLERIARLVRRLSHLIRQLNRLRKDLLHFIRH